MHQTYTDVSKILYLIDLLPYIYKLKILDSFSNFFYSFFKVELIKNRAREIADFPEDEFSALVLRARNFSLAKNRNKMSYDVTATGMYKTEDKLSSEDNDDDLDGVQLRPHGGCCPMTYQSSPFSRHQESCIIDMEQVDKRTDNDSGICNSSKATTSIGSYSDRDSDGDDRGCFDYYPSSTVKITTPTTTYHLDYDEAHEVDSDRNDIESPRSGKGSDSEPTFQGVQMKTYSRRTVPNHDDDFETDDDSDNDSRNLHQRLYGRERKRNINYYTPMTHERYEEYDNTSTSTFSFEKSQMALKDRSGSSLRDVDEPINFPMYSRHSNYRGSTSSDRVRIEKNSYRRDGYGNDPPFGQGLDQLNKVGSSIGELISSTKHTVDGMPEGRPISQSLDLAAEDGKKKKKKKRGSKGIKFLFKRGLF